MDFGPGKFLAALTSPSQALVLIGLVGLAGVLLGRRWGRFLSGLSLLLWAVIAITPLGTWALLPLEGRFLAPTAPQMALPLDGIIVLGGAVMPVASAEHGSPQLTQEAERITVLPGLMRRFPSARLIFTGGSGDPRRPDAVEAPHAVALLSDLGIDQTRVMVEAASRNTMENARNVRPLIPPGGRWLLVTSASHMPRAMGVFRRALPDIKLVPYPVAYNANRTEAWRFGLSLTDNMDRLDRAAYEWRGLLFYRLSGHIDELFPAP